MEILLALMTGVLYAAGIYMILRRSLVKLILGLILLGNGVNLLIFLLGGITKGKPPVIPDGPAVLGEVFAAPLPQALILTAIVISFGLQSFAIVLIKRAYKVVKTDDLDEMNTTDENA
ncbi:multicomponent Na+:H+ antiporter subunit C [Algoriphagus alkaliphilus]|jgi:multicomponent Na+:H+ antiporter subunit C|uniref:Multicomponent Na+:H+ antiporter subunit C n=1 Tax=Algoriphagus alkaliphilus TaxID=279824 RepID=A0A1G5X8N8_9BACT|nr:MULTISPECIES: Na+/H+ antiporter subunit C [Algoriphagus]MBA4298956.1 cation:proton antiporter [Cyclobacterium sp.]MDO8967320.1 Na+/H+ antiporter subunit C [Algoriphagus sp.]MDP2040636.1 Na+/H+ antiporter subunit C [Algoriphagus sp.]MDP3199580.1 Na+/H+ antiporter subunit C [Algoriphagus sp.]MDP3470940.1 Na+/H+ antiporter subunit C [Algoriphagus sp.]